MPKPNNYRKKDQRKLSNAAMLKKSRLAEKAKEESVERVTAKKPFPSYEEMLSKVKAPPKTAMDSVRTMPDRSMKKDTMKQMKKKDMMYGGVNKKPMYAGGMKKMKHGGSRMKKGKKC